MSDNKKPNRILELIRSMPSLGDIFFFGKLAKLFRAIAAWRKQRKLRKALRSQSKDIGIAVLAEKSDDLESALKDASANWVYVRFIPTTEQVALSHKAGKKVLVVGKLVMGREPENWKKAKEAGVDALLTDHPLECRQLWRK